MVRSTSPLHVGAQGGGCKRMASPSFNMLVGRSRAGLCRWAIVRASALDQRRIHISMGDLSMISRMKTALLACSILSAAPAFAQTASTAVASAEAETVRFGTWGVDLSARDLSVKPGDDFQRYASGAWLDANENPPDKSQNGVGSELNDRNQVLLRNIITSAPRTASSVPATPAGWTRAARGARFPTAAGRPRQRSMHRQQADFTRFMAGHWAISEAACAASAPSPTEQPGNDHAVRRYVRHGAARPRYYLLDKYQRSAPLTVPMSSARCG